MSKIPQGEWHAIAARYAQGESISAIARTYGCTPPAIHYILKNNRRRGSPQLDPPAQKLREMAVTVVETVPEQQPSLPPAAIEPHSVVQAPPRFSHHYNPPPTAVAAAGGTRTERHLSLVGSVRRENHSPTLSQQLPRPAARVSAGSEGLDSELHDRAEAAIEAFRSCFDAALAEGSPRERARLREAASNLMRVAARTTIVLDRLNALSERSGVEHRSNNGQI